MGHKRLRPQVVNAHILRRRQRMSRINHEHQIVPVKNRRVQLLVFRLERQHPELHLMHQNLPRNISRQRTLHLDFDRGVHPVVQVQRRQQTQRGEFVGRHRQLAFVQTAQLA